MSASGPTVEARVRTLVAAVEELVGTPERRVFLGVVGAPGSGKSTLSSLLHETLGPSRSVIVPMDGFHLAQAVIADTPLERRRGAIDTFDGWGYLDLLQRIARQGDETVYAPAYRRGLEDPIAASIAVAPEVPVIITEGNYLLVDDDPWRQVRDLLTETWFVETDERERVERLVERHVTYGKAPAAARAWVNGPDAANAAVVQSTRDRADRIVPW